MFNTTKERKNKKDLVSFYRQCSEGRGEGESCMVTDCLFTVIVSRFTVCLLTVCLFAVHSHGAVWQKRRLWFRSSYVSLFSNQHPSSKRTWTPYSTVIAIREGPRQFTDVPWKSEFAHNKATTPGLRQGPPVKKVSAVFCKKLSTAFKVPCDCGMNPQRMLLIDNKREDMKTKSVIPVGFVMRRTRHLSTVFDH
jgi:hypothetical protein